MDTIAPQSFDKRPVFDKPFRGRIYDSIVETIGNTPLVRIPRIAAEEGLVADLCLKLEFFNPTSSVKDRIGVNMILSLEREGRIRPGDTLIEPTSGNTGIGLAFVAASRGYRLILTMPESVSIERRKMLAFLGAELELTPKREGHGRRRRPAPRNCCTSTPGRRHAQPIRQSAQPGNPPPHHGRGNLARHAGRSRRHRLRHRHGRHADRHRPGAEAAAARPAHGGRGTGRQPRAVRRQAGAAQAARHRRRLRAGRAGPRRDRRNRPGERRRKASPGPASSRRMEGIAGRHFLRQRPGGGAGGRQARRKWPANASS